MLAVYSVSDVSFVYSFMYVNQCQLCCKTHHCSAHSGIERGVACQPNLAKKSCLSTGLFFHPELVAAAAVAWPVPWPVSSSPALLCLGLPASLGSEDSSAKGCRSRNIKA